MALFGIGLGFPRQPLCIKDFCENPYLLKVGKKRGCKFLKIRSGIEFSGANFKVGVHGSNFRFEIRIFLNSIPEGVDYLQLILKVGALKAWIQELLRPALKSQRLSDLAYGSRFVTKGLLKFFGRVQIEPF